MTRAPTPDKPPLVRVVGTEDGDLVATITERGVALRPKRSRTLDGNVFLPWGVIYQRALMARAMDAAPKPTRRKRVKRGLL